MHEELLKHKTDKTHISYQKMADKWDVKKKTLLYCVQGGRSWYEYSTEQQYLQPEEENMLVDFMLEQADCGFPLTHCMCAEKAESLYFAK
ncbi:hypothetical protein FRB95_004636, partial [Tulasnella sp. JGI-2019a]